jgi:GAF domain-containing protein
MAGGPVLDDKQLGVARLASLLSTAVRGQNPNRWIDLARSLADQLRSPSLDWRDLARALEQVRTHAAASGDSGLLDRAALLAMRLSDSAPPKASVGMLEVCEAGVAPEEMLRLVSAILQCQIPYDLISYSEYYHGSEPADSTTLIRGRFAMDGGFEFRWPARWIEVPAGVARWAEGNRRWVADSEEFYAEHPEAETLRANIVTREYEKRGATSFLVAPLIDGDRIKGALTLARRRNNPHGAFGQADQYKLDTLRLDPVLRRVSEAFDTRAEVIAKDIIALFTPRASPIKLAQQVVEKLGRGFDWEYVGLYRVNRALDKFEVVAEYDAHGALKPTLNYTQDLAEGLLGATLSKRRALYVPDVTKEPAPYGYIKLGTSQASALTFPVKMGPESHSQIEWILDLESSQFDAFPYPEQEILRRIVQQMEQAVELWFEARLATTLLNIVEQGVVVLGGRTRIERANAAARKLLGLRKDLEFPRDDRLGDLTTYAADRATRELIIGDQASGAAVPLRLTGADGIARRALAVPSYRDEAFHRRVWLLADVEQAEWVGALKYMDTAVRAVAAQAHGRLLLAGELLRNVQGKLPSDSPARTLIERAARNLSSADLPYERIASVFDVIAAPRGRNGFLDLAAELRRFRDSLPEDDADALELGFADDPMIVKGDPERLAFAFRSLLGHLLSIRSADTQLQVSIETLRGKVFVNVALTTTNSASIVAGLLESSSDEKAPQRDRIACVESLAFSVATHAVDAVRKVVKAHRGLLEITEREGKVFVTIGGLLLAPSITSAKAVSEAPSSDGVSA